MATLDDALNPYTLAQAELKTAREGLSDQFSYSTDLASNLEKRLKGRTDPILRARQREAEAKFLSAPATFREHFKDVKNPLTRESLASQAQATIGKQLSTIMTLREQRETSIAEILKDIAKTGEIDITKKELQINTLQAEVEDQWRLYSEKQRQLERAEDVAFRKRQLAVQSSKSSGSSGLKSEPERTTAAMREWAITMDDFIASNELRGDDGGINPADYVSMQRDFERKFSDTANSDDFFNLMPMTRYIAFEGDQRFNNIRTLEGLGISDKHIYDSSALFAQEALRFETDLLTLTKGDAKYEIPDIGGYVNDAVKSNAYQLPTQTMVDLYRKVVSGERVPTELTGIDLLIETQTQQAVQDYLATQE